ncbi:hypothetical protein VOLCADRAFT_117148 [Volvox carteri f. nagariensis]|uniref:Uncharacterized protein n=1 Tax=Volvox carteri f. nagariensis TaxID=3068 RepID=D8TRT8_VOLCA|nr:uncharacterized protein VOLCADRAFT_117148 [Volvox carteri f. nagariensis]EFJ49826.1 hypothetical protein VOLCADRAFT_117148 [Volvox carteri f. nagariensis]|eukprot:XP_002949333.1 hypothetical protein VOLCADRAFT_117148 [Volvox carteri f. nagariensis]
MYRRVGTVENGDVQHTHGHHLLTEEHIKKLSEHATHWAIIQRFEDSEEVRFAVGLHQVVFTYNLFKKEGLTSLFQNGKLHRATLMAGLKLSRSPKELVPGCFFRSLDFLLQFVEAGYVYRAVTDKELAKGFPPAGWCRPPVVSEREDAEAMTAAALEGASPEALAQAPATDPIRLFYASGSWCCLRSYNTSASSVRVDVGVSPAELYDLYCQGALSEYLPMVGMVEDCLPGTTYAPACVMLPLGALLYMHEHGRPYLPLTLSELREVRSGGIMSIAVRPEARPMRLPPGVWPRVYDEPQRPGMEVPEALAATGRSGAGGGSGSGSGRSLQTSRPEPAAQFPPPQRSATGAARGGPSRQAAGGSGAGGGNSAAATAPLPPSEPEPDPILDDASRWIMPKPFDVPTTVPPVSTDATEAGGAGGGGGANGPAADGNSRADSGDAAVTPATAAAPVSAALSPSPFLQYNAGVQPSYETPPLRLFLGDRGQSGLAANWWYVDSETKDIKGPYSPEAMMLSCITPCREVHDETPVCGTDADVRPPMLPPRAAFLPLGDLLRDVSEGTYALVSRVEIVSPLARSFLGNRVRQPKAAPSPAAAAAPGQTAPVVITVQPQQPQQQPAAAAAAAPVAVSAAPPPAVPIQVVAAAPSALPPQLPPPQPSLPLPAVPRQSQQQQQQPEAAVATTYSSVPTAASVQNAVKGLPLPHFMATRPRPVALPALAGAAVPAYTLPGSVVYMPQYGHAVPYGGQAVMAQPVFSNVVMQHAVPAQAPPQLPQK